MPVSLQGSDVLIIHTLSSWLHFLACLPVPAYLKQFLSGGRFQVKELHCLVIWWSLKHGHWPNPLMHRALWLAYEHIFERINCKACLREGKSLCLKKHDWDASFTYWKGFLGENACHTMPQRLFFAIQYQKCHSACIWAFSSCLGDFTRKKTVRRKYYKLFCQVHVLSLMSICIYCII